MESPFEYLKLYVFFHDPIDHTFSFAGYLVLLMTKIPGERESVIDQIMEWEA